MKIDHISFTQLSMVFKCGIQYVFRYGEGRIIPPSASLVRGKCGHKAIENNLRQKIETAQDLPIEQVKDIFANEWEKNKYSIQIVAKDLDGKSPGQFLGAFKDSGIKMTEMFHQEQAPLIIPTAVEQKFTVKFQWGYPDLTGVIDNIAGNEINEIKFVAKSPAKDDLKYDTQVTCYDFAYRQIYNKKPTCVKKRFAIATQIPKTEVQETAPRDDDTINRFLFRVEDAMRIIEKETFQPAPIGAWWCSQNWCGYWNLCKYHP